MNEHVHSWEPRCTPDNGWYFCPQCGTRAYQARWVPAFIIWSFLVVAFIGAVATLVIAGLGS